MIYASSQLLSFVTVHLIFLTFSSLKQKKKNSNKVWPVEIFYVRSMLIQREALTNGFKIAYEENSVGIIKKF